MRKMMHAYILSGSDASTAERARMMAAAALCESGGDEPCRSCRHCRKVFSDIHPDVSRMEYTLDSRGKPRAEYLVEQIRELTRAASVLPNEARGKVFIIPRADTMNLSAQNAFLRLLEEPPHDVVFLLCTANRERLLETVRSRCGEIRTESEDLLPDEDTVLRVNAFFEALRDPWEYWLCCNAMDKLDNRQLLNVVEAIRREAPHRMEDIAELLRLEETLAQASRYLRANVGAKHVIGYLSAYSFRK